MATRVGELFVDLVIDAASGQLSVRQLVGALGELEVVSLGATGGLIKVAEFILQLASAATSTAVSLTALQEVAGADPKLVQQWDKAATSIVGHAGTITQAIMSVKKINEGLGLGKGAPNELNQLLGLSAYKIDANGKEVVKDAMDLMREMSAPGSKYRSLTRPQQTGALGAIFGGAGDDVFRILQAMTRGQFHPEQFDAMSDRQIGELNRVRMDELKITSQLTGLFEKLLIGGGAFDRILASISEKLQVIDKWLGSKEGGESLSIIGREVGGVGRNAKYGPLAPFFMGRDAGKFLAEQFGFAPAPLPRVPFAPVQATSFEGTLDINLLKPDKTVDTKVMRLKSDQDNRERMQTAVTWGNP